VAAVMAGELVDALDRWLVPMVGLTVTQCRVDYAFTVVVAGEPGEWFEVRIGEPFVVVRRGEEIRLDPEGDPVQMAPALAVLRMDVEHTIAFKDGRLEMVFGGDLALRVAIGEDYEAWNLVGLDGLRIVSLPGGELAVWSPRPDDADSTPS
jgi:Family of unknown function (DUF6188)